MIISKNDDAVRIVDVVFNRGNCISAVSYLESECSVTPWYHCQDKIPINLKFGESICAYTKDFRIIEVEVITDQGSVIFK